MKIAERGTSLLRALKHLTGRMPSRRRPVSSDPVVEAEFDPLTMEQSKHGHLRTLGTFGGVFTPSFLTIIGVIMYLRFSWIVSNAGLYHTIAIVVLANVITLITALSVSSIASNERMETGGAYYMINRVLGFLPGGAIGIPLYISQALSIALYIIGFSEALSTIFPEAHITVVALTTLVVLSLFGLIGAGFMVRIQYLILTLILLSFVSIALGFKPLYFNLEPAYQPTLGFWGVFAVFFPAVTGILAGVSMSGDLKDPSKSIPRGTMGAVMAGFAVYLLVPVMLAFSVGRSELLDPSALARASRWPLLVTFGVFGATLSSAIGSILAAPRTLQALGRDGALPGFLGSGVGKTGEPLIGLLISVAIAAGAIVTGSLNAVAGVLTMFFLTTYGVLNFSAGIESLVGNPSFRPSIRIPGWISFIGAGSCFGVMFLINTPATVIALVLILLIFMILNRRAEKLALSGGGVWEGFWTGLLFFVSRRLTKSRSSSGKNWRPIIQVFASEVSSHASMISLGAVFTARSGALAVYAIIEPASTRDREAVRHELDSFSATLNLPNAFTTIVETDSIHNGILVASQAAAFANRTYNTVMLGLPSGTRQDREYTAMLTGLSSHDKNILLFHRGNIPWDQSSDPIQVWWGGKEKNVRLMLILAHLIQLNGGGGRPVRLGTIVTDSAEVSAAGEALSATLKELRMSAETFVVTNPEGRPVIDLIAEHSRRVSLLLLGMAAPAEAGGPGYLHSLRSTAERLENVLFVLSNIADQEYE
jgi:solute carrier family 12 (sodium/potassium/chloride transporter), member 2